MTAPARMSCGTALAACVALALGSAAIAQDWHGWQGFRTRREAPRFAVPGDLDGGFNFCRIMYTSGRREAGGQGWWMDYPDADHHLSIRLSQMTTMGAPRARSPRWCCTSARSPAMGPAGSRSKCRTMARRGAGCFRGSVAALTVQGALADPRELSLAMPVGARGRYVRLTQLGHDPEMWWSIAELSVHGTRSP